MHRGSSKAARGTPPATETLPLSASRSAIGVDVEIGRAGRREERHLELPPGSLVRDAVRAVGLAPEGTVVLVQGVSVPLDLPLEDAVRLVVVPTFSGG